jgi:hypothetical protein
MSLYVFISRRVDPLDDAGPAITAEEWISCVDIEPDFRLPAESEKNWLGGQARMWKDYKYPVAFDWTNGHVEVKNADAATISRMMEIAKKLSAKVFSETGELFDQSGNHAGFLNGFP